MRILIGLIKLNDFTGSETYTLTLGDWLIKQGHLVHFYGHKSCNEYLLRNRMKICWNNRTIHSNPHSYDVILTMHQGPTKILRSAFPSTPLVAVHHGIIPEEQPVMGVLYQHNICVSEEIKKQMPKYIEEDRIQVIPNMINLEEFNFQPKSELSKKILWGGTIYSRKLNSLNFTIQLMKQLPEADLEIIGQISMKDWKVPRLSNVNYLGTFEITSKILGLYDIVIGVGRVALQAMAVGRPVIIMGKDGVDGLLGQKNYHELKFSNFSGRSNPQSYSSPITSERYTAIIRWLLKDTYGLYRDRQEQYRVLRERHSVEVLGPQVESLLQAASSTKK